MCDPKKLAEIKASKAKYDEKVAKVLQKMPERRAEFVNTSGIPVNRVYTPLDMADFDYLQKLGLPGQYPYTRGVQPTMYRGRFWTMRQYAGFGTAEETNERYHYLLKSGQTGLSRGLRPAHPDRLRLRPPPGPGGGGQGGRGHRLPGGHGDPLRRHPAGQGHHLHDHQLPGAVLLAMYLAVAEKQGVASDKLRGTIQNDILKEYISRGTYIFPPQPSMRLITDIFDFCTKEVPQWNTISISGYHIREAGSTAVQEIAFTLANGIAYVEAAIKAGMNVDDFAPRLSFFFNAHTDFLEEVAKFRAARRLWAKIMKERFGAKTPAPDAALPYPDRRLHPDRPAAPEQHRAGGLPGPGRRPGRHPVPAHQLLRRGPGPAVADRGAGGPAHPAGHCLRDRGERHCRPPGAAPITWRT